MERAYSFLNIKSVSDGRRRIEGMATTPSPDRVGDIVEPMGASFRLPLPLLLDHNHLEAVGEVETARATAEGIPFAATIRTIDRAGEVKDLCDKAWSLVTNGLRKAVSIGFRSLQREPIKGGGWRFKEWEWMELSLVAVPANADATISSIKSLDRKAMRRAHIRRAAERLGLSPEVADLEVPRIAEPTGPAPFTVTRIAR